MQSGSIEGCKSFCKNITNNVEGIDKVDFLEVSMPVLDSSIKNVINTIEHYKSDQTSLPKAHATWAKNYALMYYLKLTGKLDKIYPVLRLNENVVYCDYTSGKYNLVLLVSGDYFSGIDKFIESKIVNLDGVLKVKEYPVINLFEM